MLEELRPVRLDLSRAPQVGDKWEFQLVRRAGQNIALPWQQLATGLTQEDAEGSRYARRVRGSPVARLDLLHSELRALEKASSDKDSGLEPSVAAPLISKLQEQLVEVGAKAKASEAVMASSRAPVDEGAPAFVFYQSADGQLIFPEPSLVKKMLSTFGTWGNLPERLSLNPLKAVHAIPVTEDLQRRHRFLSHLTVGGEISFADGAVDLPVAGQSNEGQGHGDNDQSGAHPRKQRSDIRQRGGRGPRGGRSGQAGRGGRGYQGKFGTVENTNEGTRFDRDAISTHPTAAQDVPGAFEEPCAAEEPHEDCWSD